jgi:hypothetical protein
MKSVRAFKIYHHHSIWISIIVCILNIPISDAHGCTCRFIELQEAFDTFENAMVGTVTKVEPANSQEALTVAKVSVSRSLKGEAFQTILMATPANGAICGFSFTEGDEYLLFAYSPGHKESSSDYYYTSLCMRNTNLSTEVPTRNYTGPHKTVTRPRVDRAPWREWIPEKVRLIFTSRGYSPQTSNWDMNVTYNSGTSANPHTIAYSFDLEPETNVYQEVTFGTGIFQDLPAQDGVYQINLQPRCPESMANDSVCFQGVIDTVIISGRMNTNADSELHGQKNTEFSQYLYNQSGLSNAQIVLTDLKGRRFEFDGLHAAIGGNTPNGCYMRQFVDKKTGRLLYTDKAVVLR